MTAHRPWEEIGESKRRKMINAHAEFYNQHGDISYDFDDEHTDFELAEIEFALLKAYLPPKTHVLQLFCGAGRHVLEFAKNGLRSVGMDISPFLLDKARALLDQKKQMNASLVCADVLAQPFGQSIFGCATALGNSISLLNDPQLSRLYCQTHRGLKSGGVFIIDIPDFDFLITSNALAFDANVQTKHFFSKANGPGLFSWTRVFDPESCRIISNETIVFHPNTRREQKYNTRFCINVLFPDDLQKLGAKHGFRHVETIIHDDTRGIYRGMIKRRFFMVYEAL